MKKTNQRKKVNIVKIFGVVAIFLGIVLNKWVVEFLFSPDNHIGSTKIIVCVFLFQIVFIVFGVFALIKSSFFIRTDITFY